MTSFSERTRPQALAILVLTVASIGWCLSVATSRELIPSPPPGEKTDLELYRRIVNHVHDGESYYDAAARELRAMHYPTRSVFNWRTPPYAWVNGMLPGPLWGKGLLILLCLATILMAGDFVMREGRMVMAVTNGLLLIGALMWCIGPDNCLVTELWSGTLIALSVCAYAQDRWRLAVALGLMALFFRELALPYCVISLGLAAWHRRKPEAAAWLVGLGLYVLFMTYHALQVTGRLTGTDLAHKESWIQFGGVGFLLATARMNFLLMGLPAWCTAVYLPLSLLGLAGWRGSMGHRVALATGIYVAAFAIVGMPVNFYWGLMYTPLLTFGFARSAISLRDLASAVLRPQDIAAEAVRLPSFPSPSTFAGPPSAGTGSSPF
jgi:hypothetical protein